MQTSCIARVPFQKASEDFVVFLPTYVLVAAVLSAVNRRYKNSKSLTLNGNFAMLDRETRCTEYLPLGHHNLSYYSTFWIVDKSYKIHLLAPKNMLTLYCNYVLNCVV